MTIKTIISMLKKAIQKRQNVLDAEHALYFAYGPNWRAISDLMWDKNGVPLLMEELDAETYKKVRQLMEV